MKQSIMKDIPRVKVHAVTLFGLIELPVSRMKGTSSDDRNLGIFRDLQPPIRTVAEHTDKSNTYGSPIWSYSSLRRASSERALHANTMNTTQHPYKPLIQLFANLIKGSAA